MSSGVAPARFDDPGKLVQAIIDQVGSHIVLGLPLGLGKANHVANALFARALADPSIKLHIFSALTLEAPRPKSELEARFLGPIIERLMGGYPSLAYAKAQRAGELPPNIEVDEFFFQAGTRLSVGSSQRSYIAANYTHAARYLLDRGVNVVAQLVAPRGQAADARYSLSCNTDITLDLLAARDAGRADFLLVGQTNQDLPFMPGDGDLSASRFTHMLDSPDCEFPLFAPPKEPVQDAHYAIGFQVAALVPDGGTLQIGIGSVGDAVSQALLIRHRQPEAFAGVVASLTQGPVAIPQRFEAFDQGLYACSEMFVDCLLDLVRGGIVKREVDGAVLHGGFFLGPRAFYAALREMAGEDLAKLQMKSISFINELYGDEMRKREARIGGRFINTAMMATLMGAVISDGLEDGRVVSGVGGQYNFVAQAFALEDARSIIALNAVRGQGRKATSNIVWNYGHVTIPRHLRDIVVTEYGVADLRGKTDRDVVAAMLGVADSRFQPQLLAQAKAAGKIEPDYAIPAHQCDNRPERIARVLAGPKASGAAPLFPFGSDFNDVEMTLLPTLARLKAAQGSPLELVQLALKGLRRPPDPALALKLERLGLSRPQTAKEQFYAWLVRGADAPAHPTDMHKVGA
ncbi:MAG: acetyl-CoA hydrolase/transferase C-terminal domain-containing protein [Phenylobacterium sp.]|uniref:acetyl-CoA hydrolase/transferase C-terminal domain-containing protein n=1 Tax=Phenylobacterium sp. TaxID=1871053 RepID=UPI0027247704|nr:acetyl-CoA hydrolase/transferase C-terminal domain-containing protein [Phenylobacterium sp.]MDO9432323.1 acetyl-CoA hydrolase/transferase C-terminal domain-containing protein [Phenylobacterium sp.]